MVLIGDVCITIRIGVALLDVLFKFPGTNFEC